MAPLTEKAMVSVEHLSAKSPSEEEYMTEKDKDALRTYRLSAAELLAKDLDDRGVPLEKGDREPRRAKLSSVARLWNRMLGRNTTQVYHDHLKSQFSGKSGHNFPLTYYKPYRHITDDDVEIYAHTHAIDTHDAKRPFLDPYGRVVWKYEDVDVYLSPTRSLPRRLIVMSTDAAAAEMGVTWRRSRIKGNVPLALKMAEWALDKKIGWIHSTLRVIVVAMPLQALLAFPGANAPWEMDDIDDTYRQYTGYHWKWPKHAINPLDARAVDLNRYQRPQLVSSKQRLLRPRQLMVYANGEWSLCENPPRNLQYIFISYHWGSFEGFPTDSNGLDRVDRMARQLTLEAGFKAYFRDEHCIAKADAGREVKTSDINRMCDVIRGSHFVALLLPDSEPRRMVDWGQRLWTLPEGMLAPGNLHVVTYHDEDLQGSIHYTTRSMSRAELTAEFWHDEAVDDDVPVRALAEHYDGTATLGRLELFSSSIAALSVRKTTEYSGADLGYALMGLLHYRIDPDPTDDLFQVIARLSLSNDNDRLIERCVSLFPMPTTDIRQLLRMLAAKDQYHSHLWDITPRCEVVGVGDEENTVILNDCRAVPIRWKRFPRMMYKRDYGFAKMFAETVVRSGAWWMVAGYSLAITYAPILIGFGNNTGNTKYLWYAVLLFIGISLILACFAPKGVRRLFGGDVLQSAPHLVAFEGTLPKAEIEKILFGNNRDRLGYEPSSTPFAIEARHKYLRSGNEPEWIAASQQKPTLPGHRIFTLVDTGNLSISIFQAKRPPTLALITGAEGGMLRAVLCSWRFSNDCHYRETVIRVPTSTWEQTEPAGWIKVCLQSQNDFLQAEYRMSVNGLAPKGPVGSLSSANGGSNLGAPPSSLNHVVTTQPVSTKQPEAFSRPSVSDTSSGTGAKDTGNVTVAQPKKAKAKRERRPSEEPNTVGIEIAPKKERSALPEPLRIARQHPEPFARPESDDYQAPSSSINDTVYYSPPGSSVPLLLHQSEHKRTSATKHTSTQPSVASSQGPKSHRASTEPAHPLDAQVRKSSDQTAADPAFRRRPVRMSAEEDRALPALENDHREQKVANLKSQNIGTEASTIRAVYRSSSAQIQRDAPGRQSADESRTETTERSRSASSHSIPLYKVPSPPPQLPPLNYSPTLPATTPEQRSKAKAKTTPHPLASRFSAVQTEPRSQPGSAYPPSPDKSTSTSQPRWSWGAEEEDTIVAKPSKLRDQITRVSKTAPRLPSPDRSESNERTPRESLEKEQRPSTQGSGPDPNLTYSNFSYSSMVSPRIDFSGHSWEYWNGSEADSEGPSRFGNAGA